MVLVDSSVWIAWLRNQDTAQTQFLEAALDAMQRELVIGDLILTEVLQGVRSDREAGAVATTLADFRCIDIAGADCAIEAAANYRRLRALGITPRKAIDTLIATRCILDGLELLHADRDSSPFAAHLGLKEVVAPV